MATKTKSFSRLSAADKRVAIAEDILKQIKAKQYIIETGTWLDVSPIDVTTQKETELAKSKTVQSALLGGSRTVVVESLPATCTCCAVGAACASAIRLFNQDTLEGSPQYGYDLGTYREGVSILRRYFPEAQVDLMEAAFEMRIDTHHREATEAALKKAVDFGQNYELDDERLKAICKNIIKNKGTFRP